MDDLLKAPLWQKIIAGAIVVLAAAWLLYGYVYKPKIVEISRLRRTLVDLDLKLKVYAGDTIVVKNGSEIKAKLEQDLQQAMRKIPTESEIPFLLNSFVSEMGKGLDISYKTIAPADPVSEGAYKRIPIKIEFTSQYPDFNSYILQLKELPTTIRVDNLVINRLKGNPPELGVGMLLSAFVMPAGKVNPREESPKPAAYYVDPFAEEASMEAVVPRVRQAASPFRLQGIWSGDKTKAFINGKMLGVGDKISGYTVSSISDKKVVITKSGKSITLKMGAEE